jgi:subtilisin family serine protease
MKHILTMLTALAAVSISCTKEIRNEAEDMSAGPQTLMTKLVGGQEGKSMEGSLLFKVDDALLKRIEAGEDMSGTLLNGIPVKSFTYALPAQPKNVEAARKYGLHKWFRVCFDENMPVHKAAEIIAAAPEVKAVQFDSYLEPVSADAVMPFSATAVTKSGETAEAVFDDIYLSHQWNLINEGKAGAVAGADVGVKDAWRLCAGDPSVVVAVFDCAVNNFHEDLKDAVWVNEKEKNGTSGTDDDGNGYIDDIYGFNFVGCNQLTSSVTGGFLEGQKPSAIKGRSLNWNKGTGHGTHVAGIIGATNGNGKGVSSIAGGSGNGDGVRLMTCQIFEGNEYCSDAQNAAAFIYAADNGACIAQCSYGEPNIITNDDTFINGNEEESLNGSPLEYAALQYFLDPSNSNHQSLEGNLAIFAAGNHKNPYSIYPGALSFCISVTAIRQDFLPGSYTNYGPGCKIAAPGGEYAGSGTDYSSMILSTGVSNAATASPAVTGSNGRADRNYVYMQGTSMACPHVSGVAALGISHAKKLGKKFTREEFTSMILTSVNDMYQHFPAGSKYLGQMGTGSIDAWKLLMAVEGIPSVMVKAGESSKVDMAAYCNPSGEYEISVDEATRKSLGLTSDPVIRNGKLEIKCTAIGSGKITISSSVGKDEKIENGIGGMNFSREISIVSRPFATKNGGWL